MDVAKKYGVYSKEMKCEIDVQLLSTEFGISEETLKRLINFYRCKVPYRAISEHFNIDRKTLFQIYKRAGLVEERNKNRVTLSGEGYKITDENLIIEIVEAYCSGKSITWISNKVKRGYVSVKHALEEAGISLKYSRDIQNEKLRNEVIESYKIGMTVKQIAEKFEINQVIITETLKKAGFLHQNDVINMPKELLDKIVAEYEAGTTVKNICEKFKINYRKLNEIISFCGIEQRKGRGYKQIDESLIENVKRAHEAGESAEEIQKEFQITHTTYYNILRMHGLQRKQIKERVFSDTKLAKRIIKYYQSGYTLGEVSEKYKLPVSLVQELLVKNKIEIRRGNNKKKHKPYDVNKIIKAYESGMTWNKMAKEFNMSVSWLQVIFKKHGIVKKRVKKNKPVLLDIEEEKKKIISFYESGVSVRKLAQEYNTSEATIKRILQKANIYIRDAGEAKILLSKQEQEERKNNIADAYRNGMTIEKIRHTYHVNQRTIFKIIEEREIPRRIIRK